MRRYQGQEYCAADLPKVFCELFIGRKAIQIIYPSFKWNLKINSEIYLCETILHIPTTWRANKSWKFNIWIRYNCCIIFIMTSNHNIDIQVELQCLSSELSQWSIYGNKRLILKIFIRNLHDIKGFSAFSFKNYIYFLLS